MRGVVEENREGRAREKWRNRERGIERERCGRGRERGLAKKGMLVGGEANRRVEVKEQM